MKQKKWMGLIMASLLVLSGCSSSTVSKDGKDVIASIDEMDYLADDMYNELSKTAAGKSLLFSYVLDELIKANFPVNDAMKKNADDIKISMVMKLRSN